MAGAQTPIELPEPCLVALVGPAGSGKTTFAARYFRLDEVVSSDALRAALTGDAADQSANGMVFAALHGEVAARLAAGRTVVVDATNVEAHARRALVRIAARAGRPAIAIVLDVGLAEALVRNARRPGRAVPADVVERHERTLDRALARHALDWEGFAAVHVLDGVAAVDGARILRTGPAPDGGG